MPRRKKLEEFYTRVWTEADAAAALEFFSPDFSTKGMVPDVTVGPEDFMLVVQAMHSLVDEPRFEIRLAVQDDTWIAAYVTFHAIDKAKGAPVFAEGATFVRFVDMKIVEAYNIIDFVPLFTQLGLLPAETIELCLSGGALQ